MDLAIRPTSPLDLGVDVTRPGTRPAVARSHARGVRRAVGRVQAPGRVDATVHRHRAKTANRLT